MPIIPLGYGNTQINFTFDESRFQVLGAKQDNPALSDAEISAILDNPIDSHPLEDIINPGKTVLIAVPDATRATGSGQIVNLIVRRLIANGTMPHEIACIFSTGIHRRVTDDEKRELLTPFIFQRIKTIDHEARNLADIIKLGTTSGNIPIELNRALVEYDHVILVGGITFHYFAGFSGGRKLVCPGLASSRTVGDTHKQAFDFDRKTRRDGVGSGLLDGNAVHEAFIEVVEKINPAFSISTVTNQYREITDFYAGHWKTSHRAACDAYLAANSVSISEKRDVVVVSCGGSPSDINMIQAHKALDTASYACREGGTIIWLAECADGLGRKDFLKWFQAADSADLAQMLCDGYQVNGQTAWSLLEKAERFNVRIVTSLSDDETRQMRLNNVSSFEAAVSQVAPGATGYILPFGSKVLVRG